MLGLPDGRYLARAGGLQSVLVLLSTGAPAPGRRRRRKPRASDAQRPPEELPLTRATAVRAFEPFQDTEEALRWLGSATASDEAADAVIEHGAVLLNRALHVAGIAAGDPFPQERSPWSAAAVRIGIGTGEEVAESLYTEARAIDIRSGSGASRRDDAIRPQERIAAVLGDREDLDACETLYVHARRDLDAGRWREAALQLRVGLEALLIELQGAMSDPGHDEDMETLAERRQEAGAAGNQALKGSLDAANKTNVRQLIEIGERVLRRRRVLHG